MPGTGWTVTHSELSLHLDDTLLRTTAALHVGRKHPTETVNQLVLDGTGVELVEIAVDGHRLAEHSYQSSGTELVLDLDEASDHVLTLQTVAPISPTPTLGMSSCDGVIYSCCEPEGYRRIAFGLDRPDQRSTYDVTLIADKRRYPTLLANGHLVESGDLDDGRHWARFSDPIPKPTYLFAVVAGDLATRHRRHVTGDGRSIDLQVVAQPASIDGAGFALDVLAEVMRWDEEHGAPPYDLDVLIIAAVPGYPNEASESHGLMLFDPAFMIADPAGHTADDLAAIEMNLTHEYLHHWRGNRVTVASWNQLALKEGLATLAQHDVGAAREGPSSRLHEIFRLRRLQFPDEVVVGAPVLPPDGTPAAHAYTRTAYFKGTEVFRMLREEVGNEVWSAAMHRFGDTFDLAAATVDDLVGELHVTCEERGGDAGAIEGIARWFTLVGRPRLTAAVASQQPGRCSIRFERTDSLADDPPVTIPIDIAFFAADGAPLAVTDTARRVSSTAHRVHVTDRSAELTVESSTATALVPSILRGYSAPVDLVTDRPDEQLAMLVRHDDDPAGRRLAAEELIARSVDARRTGDGARTQHATTMLAECFGAVLAESSSDPLLAARILAPPDEHLLGDREPVIDVDGIHHAVTSLRRDLATALAAPLREVIERYDVSTPAGMIHADVAPGSSHRDGPARSRSARHALVDVCLGYLLELRTADDVAVAVAHIDSPDPTVATRALANLAHHDTDLLEDALRRTYRRWQNAPRLLDWWMRAQSGSRRADTIDRVLALTASGDYDRTSPARVLAVWLPFCMRNRVRFHDPSGAGYRAFVDECIQLLTMNPGVVPRLVGDIAQFQRFDPHRRALMRAELERLRAQPQLPDLAAAALDALLAA